MLTIQKFAQFCHCTAQTLRYYDRIDLSRGSLLKAIITGCMIRNKPLIFS